MALEVEYVEKNGGLKEVIKSGMAKVVKDYTSEELGSAIDEMVDKDATVVTDMWRSYPKAVKARDHLQFLSKKGENFEKLHWHIFNLKNWLRGTHHHISTAHIQQYLDEFHYRFNRRNSIQSIPKRVLSRMVKNDWLPYKQAIAT